MVIAHLQHNPAAYKTMPLNSFEQMTIINAVHIT